MDGGAGADHGEGGAEPGRRQLFRREAYERRGQVEPIDGLLRVTAPHEWAVLVAVAAAVAGLAVWSVFGSIERGVSAGCEVVYPGERLAVTAAAGGTVRRVMVAAPGRVTAGQPLASLTVPDLELEAALARARLAAAEALDPAGAPASAARAEARALAESAASGVDIVSPVAGELVASRLVAGTAVAAGDVVAVVHEHVAGPPVAVAVLAGDDAARVAPGMRARVVVTDPAAGGRATLEARVVEVSAGPPDPAAGSEPAAAVPAGGREARLAFEAAAAHPSEGAGCSARIIVTEQRPIRLLGSAR